MRAAAGATPWRAARRSAAAAASIQLGTAYVEVPTSGSTTDAYLVIRNNGPTDQLISARTSVGGRVTFRAPTRPGGTTMKTVPDIGIPADSLLRLSPDGSHLLITGARAHEGRHPDHAHAGLRQGRHCIGRGRGHQPAKRRQQLLPELTGPPPHDLPTAVTSYRLASEGDEIYRLAYDAEADYMATGPDLRIGDADREAAAESLREHYAQGRLTLDEFNQRLDAVFAATTQRQLNQLTCDLPHAAAPRRRFRSPARGRERAGRISQSGCGQAPGPARHFPRDHRRAGAWLVLSDLHLRAFPWPGKLAIFLAILTLIRGLLRRMLAAGRGRGGSRARGADGAAVLRRLRPAAARRPLGR